MTWEHLRKLRELLRKAAESLTDEDASQGVELFEPWQTDTAYATNKRIRYGEKLYKVLQAHTSQQDWTPDSTPSLYAEVAKPGQGDTPDNPIPYGGNMALVEGKYYEQSDVIYVCIRDTINPVYANLSELINLYVRVYND